MQESYTVNCLKAETGIKGQIDNSKITRDRSGCGESCTSSTLAVRSTDHRHEAQSEVGQGTRVPTMTNNE